MVVWLLEAVSYAAIAALVCALNWHRSARLAGATLLLASVISSITFFTLPLFELRVMREAILSSLIATVAATLWVEGECRRSCQVVLLLAFLDTTLCGAICYLGSDDATMRSLFGWCVNAIFLEQCTAIAVPGARDAVDAWIAAIRRERDSDSASPDFDWLLGKMD
jgi:hypothetical protein